MGNSLRICETETRDWAALPDELVGSIAKRLPLPDHARLHGVCASWAAEVGIYPPSASHFPWLMLNANGGRTGTGCFLSLTDSRSYCHLPGTVAQKATCVGSSRDGWLVILDGCNNLFLRNPITAAQINLPSFDTLPWSKSFFDVRKVAISASAVVAVAVFYSLSCCHLAYTRVGDEEWTPLDFLSPPNQRIEDIAYHGNKFFVVFTRGRVQSFDLTSDTPNASTLYGNCDSLGASLHISYNLYLVSSSDNLLQVRREKQSPWGNTTNFRVSKFDSGSDSGWVEIKDLDNQCLFLDNKSSFSVSTTTTTTTTELRRNCIYFADEMPHSAKVNAGDLRMFDMDKGIVYSLPLASSKIRYRLLMSPVWFMPSV